ncbi:hypothetical protein FRB94_003161 [Tulasnella sp. JGI-2019a]|nr:hypothetical protein FRB94_003161 [Tulasnella sp. JGI-2019a]
MDNSQAMDHNQSAGGVDQTQQSGGGVDSMVNVGVDSELSKEGIPAGADPMVNKVVDSEVNKVL